MFSDRKDIHPVLAAMLNAVYSKCCASLRSKKEAGEVVFNDLRSVLEEEWSAAFTETILAGFSGFIPKEMLEKLPAAKKEIFNRLRPFASVKAVVLCAPEEGSDWVTAEVKAKRYYWPLCREYMALSMGEEVACDIDNQTEAVLRRLHNPKDETDWKVRGLVIGSVQSGKTANYSALISKAADAGYKIIIILSGVHNDLRSQTQKRLEEAFCGVSYSEEGGQKRCGVGTLPGYDPSRAPVCATTVSSDFRGNPAKTEVNPWLFVVKKNTSVFKKLVKWLEKEDTKKRPLLIIDDEADLASINTKNNGDLATETNKFIRRMLQIFSRASFVAYTATPFANILINSKITQKIFDKSSMKRMDIGEDLFPKDFMYQLKAPDNYYGPSQFFGDGEGALELYREIPRTEAGAWLGYLTEGKGEDGLPSSVKEAVLQFILSSAIRLWRMERRASSESVLEQSMLIHVSHLTKLHSAICRQAVDFAEEAAATLLMKRGPNPYWKLLEELWEEQVGKTESTKELRADVDTELDWSLPDSLEDLVPELEEVLEGLEVAIVNGTAKNALKYRTYAKFGEERGRTRARICIGGNKLSRGLTLPGLCVSVFLRGSSMYDTLMQMGRWFGYRDGYADLCRIFTTADILEKFRMSTLALLDVFEQVEEMQTTDRTPENFLVKILSYPGLTATARNKMFWANRVYTDYSGVVSEQRLFDITEELLGRNRQIAEKLVRKVSENGALAYHSGQPELKGAPMPPASLGARPSGRLWKNVPVEIIADFLTQYRATADGSQAGLVQSILRLKEEGRLSSFNVFVPGKPDSGSFLGSIPVTRRKSVKNKIINDQVHLGTLKEGASELYGVSEEIYHAALALSGEGSIFKKVRRAAGNKGLKGSREGFFQLYSFIVGEDASGRLTGEGRPLISYYLWLPEHDRPQNNLAYVNSTIIEEEEDVVLDREDEKEDDENE